MELWVLRLRSVFTASFGRDLNYKKICAIFLNGKNMKDKLN